MTKRDLKRFLDEFAVAVATMVDCKVLQNLTLACFDVVGVNSSTGKCVSLLI